MTTLLVILMSLLAVVILIGDAWSFLDDRERARLLLWAWLCPWVPDRLVETDWFTTLFWRYVRFDQKPDVTRETPLW